jgi:Ferritin-like
VPYSTIGQLYRDIEDGFTALTTRYGEKRVFIGPPRAQATSALLPFPGLTPVTDLASALHAIDLIVEQGEGLRGDIENSHYARFLAIRGELDRLRAARPDFEPARPVMENPFTEPPADCAGYNLMDHPQARAVSELFNACYGLMLEMLMRFFAHTEESQTELSALIDTAIGIMEGVIKPLGTILTSLPATSNADAPRAGPSFAFYRSINYLPHRDAAWALFAERFEELAEFSGKLADGDEARIGLDTVHASIQALSAALGQHMRIPRSLKVTHV